MGDGAALVGRRVKAILTTRFVCCACGRGFTTPRNDGCDGIGECERCGCTSYHVGPGRAWGPRHRFWSDWARPMYYLDDENRVTARTIEMFTPFADDLPDFLVFE